jgi:hypothetical protein
MFYDELNGIVYIYRPQNRQYFKINLCKMPGTNSLYNIFYGLHEELSHFLNTF